LPRLDAARYLNFPEVSGRVPVEGIGDQVGEDFGEGRWLTYSELAQIRGIGRESAVKLVQRERWRRVPGNDRDRTVRVFVPAEWLRSAKGGQIGEVIPEGSGELSRLLSSFQDTIAFVRERTEAAEARADQAEADRRAADARAEAERARADRAETRVDDLRAQIDVLNAEMVVMRAEADRALAEERLRADRLGGQVEALSAEVVRAEKQAEAVVGRAERAEAGRDAERAGDDALRDRIAALQAQLAVAEQAAEQARRQAQAAQDNAETLREADVARKGRGRLARLQAAWRGE
jgi:hypothetical protein